jgi:hypothetical protein
MRRILAAVVGIVSVVALSAACKKDDPPPAQPVPYAQPGYNTAPTATAPPTATIAQPVPGQMSVPGPTALACSNDSQCMTHHCNTQYGKCAFPCQSDADCIQGAACFVAGGPAAACLPKPPGQ